MIVSNLTKNNILSSQAGLADTAVTRSRGLLGRDGLFPGEGLVITRCNSIHMFFMKFSIDAVFVDRSGKVVGLVENIVPNRFSPIFWSADRVIELPAGTIAKTSTALGDLIQIK